MIVKEFFHQGDRERTMGLDISMLCDRNTNNFAKGQIGFINFMILPYFSTISAIVPGMAYTLDACKLNVKEYKKLEAESEKEMKDGNTQF